MDLSGLFFYHFITLIRLRKNLCNFVPLNLYNSFLIKN
ncbi:hypothetical protein RC62_2103 [Flavobacterium aquidurense]|uniref:Uncharacterized protein n=1 Tax=Flavobacterium aquidurense TaxID=362413 RepID=A0A0N8VMA0_9FLAO|nr:hypothetical protein RC62_2103 [Flavobacterium aquidurense]